MTELGSGYQFDPADDDIVGLDSDDEKYSKIALISVSNDRFLVNRDSCTLSDYLYVFCEYSLSEMSSVLSRAVTKNTIKQRLHK
jgi:hypothetical protein